MSDTVLTLRYLPPTTIRVVADQQGRDHASLLPHELIGQGLEAVPPETAAHIVRSEEATLRTLVAVAEELAATQASTILKGAHTQTRDNLSTEINRLKALRRVNPNIREDEIEHLESHWQILSRVLDTAKPRPDAIRVIVDT